jgi:SAM-dependent methyltransferase
MLALLKRKGITLIGVDQSELGAFAARSNRYSATVRGEPSQLPFADGTFDYVVILDSFDRLEAESDDVFAEIRRVLKPEGETLCCVTQESSDEKSSAVDILARHFRYTESRPRYSLCLGAEELLDQAGRHDLKCEPDLLEYLRQLSFRERRAFDIAMGYVFGKVSDFDISLPNSGSCFVKASNVPLGAFYNQHRDRRSLLSSPKHETEPLMCLDRSDEAVFDDGWYEPTTLPPVVRWMGKHARVRFHSPRISAIAMDLMTQIPELDSKPLGLELLLNSVKVGAFSLFGYGWLELGFMVPETLRAGSKGDFELEIRADRTAQFRRDDENRRDDRELSIAICNITFQI